MIAQLAVQGEQTLAERHLVDGLAAAGGILPFGLQGEPKEPGLALLARQALLGVGEQPLIEFAGELDGLEPGQAGGRHPSGDFRPGAVFRHDCSVLVLGHLVFAQVVEAAIGSGLGERAGQVVPPHELRIAKALVAVPQGHRPVVDPVGRGRGVHPAKGHGPAAGHGQLEVPGQGVRIGETGVPRLLSPSVG
jgi:hypothetical protein